MKKLHCILYIVLFVCCLTACSSNSEGNDISNILGINISNGTIITDSDTHGGFHGDGYTFVAVSFDDTAGAAVADDISGNSGWSMLPLTDNLQTAVYGKQDGDASYGPYIITDDSDTVIPAIEHGYYYFYDRHSESKNPKDDTDLLSRHSFNFTIALYDMDNNNLYYYEMDT